jgi:DNA-binding NtrC family response regulator
VAAARILVVDNDAGMLGAVTGILNRRGFDVFPASTPHQALDIARTASRLDLVISDLWMSEMQGGALIREITRTSPAPRGILLTADPLKAVGLPPAVPVLTKPFRTVDLLAAVEEMLVRSAQRRAKLERETQRATKLRAHAKQLCSELADAVEASRMRVERLHAGRTKVAGFEAFLEEGVRAEICFLVVEAQLGLTFASIALSAKHDLVAPAQRKPCLSQRAEPRRLCRAT